MDKLEILERKELKTICTSCVFKHLDELGCSFKKDVYINGDKQYTKGFCSIKRNPSWLKPGILKTIKDRVTIENAKITLIVPFLTGNLTDFCMNLDSVPIEYITKIIVIVQNKTKEQQKNIVDHLSLSKIPWSFHNVDGLEVEINNLDAIQYVSEEVETAWTLTMPVCQKYSKNYDVDDYSLALFHKRLRPENPNYIAFYFDRNNNEKLIYQTQAFKELEGHIEIPFLDKIMSFDNGVDVCLKIE